MVGLELIEGGLDLPALRVGGGQLGGWGLVVVQQGRDQPVRAGGVAAVLDRVADHPDPDRPGKTIKRPVDVKTGHWCNSNLPAHQYNYAEAVASASNLVSFNGTGSSPVDEAKAHIALGFAYEQLKNRDQVRAQYALGVPDLREPTCSLDNGTDGQLAIVCRGVSRKNGREMSSCIGSGCR